VEIEAHFIDKLSHKFDFYEPEIIEMTFYYNTLLYFIYREDAKQ